MVDGGGDRLCVCGPLNCALGLSGVGSRGMTVKEFGLSTLGWIAELTGSVELLFFWDRAVLCLSLPLQPSARQKVRLRSLLY